MDSLLSTARLPSSAQTVGAMACACAVTLAATDKITFQTEVGGENGLVGLQEC